MLNGVPCVASDLPGVRMPVQMHGTGRAARVGDSEDLARCILDVLANPARFRGEVETIRRSYDPAAIAREYEAVFESLLKRKPALQAAV